MSGSDSEKPQSREEFARLLRQRAENAAEASLHHATLAQRFQELSQKLSALAESSDTAGLSDLQASLTELEQTSAEESTSTRQPMTLSGNAEHAVVHTSPKSPDSPSVDVFSTDAFGSEPNAGAVTDSVEARTDPESKKASGRGGRKRRLSIREQIRKFRAAKRMGGRRVRVKAKKSDLKPKQRTATEELKKGGGSILTSVVLVTAALMLLSTITWQLEDETPLNPIICAFASEEKPVEQPQPIEPPEEEQGEQTDEETEEPVEEPEPEPEPEPELEEQPDEPEPEEKPETEMAEAAEPEVLPEAVEGTATQEDSAVTDVAAVNNRSDAGKQALLKKYGGSQASESAVQKGLEWLISVQHPQGYWDFISVGPAGSPGTVNNPIGGTAYALLPFLAAGQTHKEGNFQKQVGAGLTYLSRIGVNAPAGYDLRGMINKQSKDKAPNEAYYVHGAATLALCEAYGMTQDRRLKRAAEGAVSFLVNSQDPNGGGWRYNPQEPGSTSVTAIQLMALMAAKKSGIRVPEKVFDGVRHYLDSVQVDREGRYGYEIEKKRYTGAVTAMALLSRMYLGWGRDDGDMQAGVALLDKAGPYENLYSLYFATQVMKNWGGPEWERWNARLRDDLVAAQETDGPGKGSWKPRTGAIHAKQGGRLLTTSLATLTLEVYYRYKPLLPEQKASAAVAVE